METPQTAHKTVASALYGLMLAATGMIGLLLGYDSDLLLKMYLFFGGVGHPFFTWLVRNFPR